MTDACFLLAAYLLGSIPFGFIITKQVMHIDIREHGSKNIGATNVFRVVGKKWGIIVFILDALKGALGVRLSDLLAIHYDVPTLIGFAVMAILGHTFPVWLSFKGGKGVATSFGVFLAICPLATLFTFGIFVAVFLITHILSLGSLFAAASFPFVTILLSFHTPDFSWLFGVSLLLTVFIFYTHRKNVDRLFRGQEKKLF